MDLTQTFTSEEQSKAYMTALQVPPYRKPLGFGICRVAPTDNGRGVPHMQFVMLNWEENFGTAAALQDIAGLIGDNHPRYSHEAVVPLDRDMLGKIARVFAPFFATASEENHRNAHIIRQLAEQPQPGDLYLVFVYRHSYLMSRQVELMKRCARAAGKLKSSQPQNPHPLTMD